MPAGGLQRRRRDPDERIHRYQRPPAHRRRHDDRRQQSVRADHLDDQPRGHRRQHRHHHVGRPDRLADQPVAKVLALAGDFVEIPNTTNKFVVSADKKILVAEYMVGQSAGFGTSDPAFVLAVPSEQYRNNYLFYAQTGWQRTRRDGRWPHHRPSGSL